MEPLFKTTTDYTPEVLERMNRKVLMKSKPFITAITIMAVLIVLFTAAWVHKIGAASIILGYCPCDHTHRAENRTSEDAEFFAIVPEKM